jgi:superfamily II RNA helicase
MVKICCINEYPQENEEFYKKHYECFSHPLHIFQKWSIQAIVEGNHVLVTAPTGSGKSLPAEFALDYFHSKGKRTIYTSPIKALSNEKFYNFTKKYPHISIGLITGDIKTNPDADVLIMTTEILLNKLYQIKSSTPMKQSSISFDMDIETELGCVIYDEIHMINDESRGHVWEQSIMMLPRHIQIVGLSATLDNPEKFASWLENKGEETQNGDKIVYLTKKHIRAVPLIHYSFITVASTFNKNIRDKVTQEQVKNIINKPHVIMNENGVFNETNYKNISKTLELFEDNEIRVKRPHVLNKVCEYLVENEMLPALCYVFSRKQLEKCAEELTTNLLEFDSKVPYTVDRECEQIIRKLPNFEEYLHLPEYVNVVKLLRKGVGIHHAGLMPILREMTELLFARGFIKVLFCTETMSVGINLPVKTTIFTDVKKFNGDTLRVLHSHEYTQAAGRAGRLGLDTIGHVIHLNNLFRNVDSVNYKLMMNGKPQVLTSKFKISYNLLLNLIDIGDNNLVSFAKKSMITKDVNNQLKELETKISNLISEIESIQNYSVTLNTPSEIIEEYISLLDKKQYSVNKKRKEIERKIQSLMDLYKNIDTHKKTYDSIKNKETELVALKRQYDESYNYFISGVQVILQILRDDNLLEDKLDNSQLKLSLKGKIASQLRETHCLVFSHLLCSNRLNELTSKQLVMLFSCFTNISVLEEYKDHELSCHDKTVHKIVNEVSELYSKSYDREMYKQISTGFEYNMHYDLINYLCEWCDCENVESCKVFLQKLKEEKQIFLGEFVKALLKINNISSELEKVTEYYGNIDLLSKLKEIPVLTLKYVVTNQSLYV